MLSKIFNQIPYTARVSFFPNEDEQSIGCGVFISPEHFLTAAHVIRKCKSKFMFFKKGLMNKEHDGMFNQKRISVIAKDDLLDVAIVSISKGYSKDFLKIATSFNKNDDLYMASPNYRGWKKSKGRYLKPNYNMRPDSNDVRLRSDFKFGTPSRSGMSGSPIINLNGEIISLLTSVDLATQKIRRFRKPIGNDMGPTPQRLFEFYEPYRSHVESFHI